MSHEPSLFFISHFSLLMTLNMSSLVFQDKKLPRRGREEDAKDCRDDPLQPPHHHQVKLFVPQGKESLLKIITFVLSWGKNHDDVRLFAPLRALVMSKV